jgi:hypothetical protein
MSTVRLAATTVTPLIEFHPQEARMAIVGECYPENPLVFFDPILATLKRYFAAEKPASFSLTLRLHYVNSAATKAFRNLYLLLDELGQHGAKVAVRWEFDADDDAMEELGADLAADLHYLDAELVAFVE